MTTDIQARGFSLTDGLRAATEAEVRDYTARFPDLQIHLQVRLFDVNGQRGGLDKGCLVSAHIGQGKKVVVTSELDTDLYRAIGAAFSRLTRATRAAIARKQTNSRRGATRASASIVSALLWARLGTVQLAPNRSVSGK